LKVQLNPGVATAAGSGGNPGRTDRLPPTRSRPASPSNSSDTTPGRSLTRRLTARTQRRQIPGGRATVTTRVRSAAAVVRSSRSTMPASLAAAAGGDLSIRCPPGPDRRPAPGQRRPELSPLSPMTHLTEGAAMYHLLTADLIELERAELVRRLRRDRHTAAVRAARTARRRRIAR